MPWPEIKYNISEVREETFALAGIWSETYKQALSLTELSTADSESKSFDERKRIVIVRYFNTFFVYIFSLNE